MKVVWALKKVEKAFGRHKELSRKKSKFTGKVNGSYRKKSTEVTRKSTYREEEVTGKRNLPGSNFQELNGWIEQTELTEKQRRKVEPPENTGKLH